MFKIAIISANELRHKFFRKYLNSLDSISVELCYAEKNKTRHYYEIINSKQYSQYEKNHFLKRQNYEKKYFGKITKNLKEVKNLKLIEKEEFNLNKKLFKLLKSKKVDYIFCFGCSIIREPLLSYFKKKFINLHLGLSPYYRGSGTNYWPGVNNEPQFFGATFMKLDKGIDTGQIIHQFRPTLSEKDNIHDVGNKIIYESALVLPKLLNNYSLIKTKKIIKYKKEKIYKKKDFDLESLKQLNINLKKGMIKKYLKNKKSIDKKFPIVNFNFKCKV